MWLEWADKVEKYFEEVFLGQDVYVALISAFVIVYVSKLSSN